MTKLVGKSARPPLTRRDRFHDFMDGPGGPGLIAGGVLAVLSIWLLWLTGDWQDLLILLGGGAIVALVLGPAMH